MRDAVAGSGVKLNIVMPGYVHSKMTYDMPAPKPFMWKSEKAACKIRLGLSKDRARIRFSFLLNLGFWFLVVIHLAVSDWIVPCLDYAE